MSTGGSTEFSTGPVFGRLPHRHPESRLGLEGPEGSSLCWHETRHSYWQLEINKGLMLGWCAGRIRTTVSSLKLIFQVLPHQCFQQTNWCDFSRGLHTVTGPFFRDTETAELLLNVNIESASHMTTTQCFRGWRHGQNKPAELQSEHRGWLKLLWMCNSSWWNWTFVSWMCFQHLIESFHY